MSKQYGLIVPNKSKTSGGFQKPSIFDEDSDEDASTSKPTGLKKNLKRQDRILQKKAVEEDPTVYQYDELYDEMDQKRKESKLSRKDLDRKPKYISKLLQAADRRKRENERRIEKQVQKDREAEGEEFKDKESFVTSAYRKKLEEMKELDEQEQREEYLETIGDVKKQGNLDGFYRHLYDQKVNYEDRVQEENKEVKQKNEEIKQENEEVKEEDESKEENNEDKSKMRKRKYRKRENSEDQSDGEPEVKMEHLPSNLDADSDFSIDSSDSEDENTKTTASDNKTKESGVEADKENKTDNCEADNDKTTVSKNEEDSVKKEEIEEEEVVEKKPKIDIWKKRTVGEVFDEALQRYYERKAIREAGNK